MGKDCQRFILEGNNQKMKLRINSPKFFTQSDFTRFYFLGKIKPLKIVHSNYQAKIDFITPLLKQSDVEYLGIKMV